MKASRKHAPLLARLLRRTEKQANGCWIWSGCLTWNGYGEIGSGSAAGRTTRTHVAMYRESVGPIPAGLFVCHHCDNRACINPQHLFLGTAAENSADMRAKGRTNGPRGERSASCKLTPPQVLEIRRLATEGLSRSAIGRMFGVSKSSVSGIVTRRKWAHI